MRRGYCVGGDCAWRVPPALLRYFFTRSCPREVSPIDKPPAPMAGEVLVRVRAASLNPADYKSAGGEQAALLRFAWPRVYGRHECLDLGKVLATGWGPHVERPCTRRTGGPRTAAHSTYYEYVLCTMYIVHSTMYIVLLCTCTLYSYDVQVRAIVLHSTMYIVAQAANRTSRR